MTHNERVLNLLADGAWHTHHELYGLHVVAHSRVSDLRKRGHRIEMRRDGDLYLYRWLWSTPLLPAETPILESHSAVMPCGAGSAHPRLGEASSAGRNGDTGRTGAVASVGAGQRRPPIKEER